MRLILDVGVAGRGPVGRHREHTEITAVGRVALDSHETRLLMAALADKREVATPLDARALDRVLDVLTSATAAVRS
jgi:hypothetical protein